MVNFSSVTWPLLITILYKCEQSFSYRMIAVLSMPLVIGASLILGRFSLPCKKFTTSATYITKTCSRSITKTTTFCLLSTIKTASRSTTSLIKWIMWLNNRSSFLPKLTITLSSKRTNHSVVWKSKLTWDGHTTKFYVCKISIFSVRSSKTDV